MVRAPGIAPIGNSAPARKNGRIATAGVAPTYSSWLLIAARQRLGDAVHEHREQERGAGKPRDAVGGDVEYAAAQRREADQHDHLKGGEDDRDREVPDHQVGARDRGGEQLTLGAAVAVDDHAEPGEDAAQRDDEADGPDPRRTTRSRCASAGPPVATFERRRHDQRQQRRADQRHEDLPGVAGGQRRAPPRERRERIGGARATWSAKADWYWVRLWLTCVTPHGFRMSGLTPPRGARRPSVAGRRRRDSGRGSRSRTPAGALTRSRRTRRWPRGRGAAR